MKTLTAEAKGGLLLTIHSKLGASSADRWIRCPGSLNLEAVTPEFLWDDSSPFAEEGTAAHNLCEKHLLAGSNSPDPDIQIYLDVIRELMTPTTQLLVEQRVAINEELFGTCDAILADLIEGQLTIVDFKYGVGYAVDAIDNVQLKYYALGAVKLLGDHFNTVTVMIIQPRAYHDAGPVRSHTFPYTELLEFEADILQSAEITKDPLAPLSPSKACKFCKVKAVCPALRTSLIQGMSNPILGEALKAAENLSIYKASLERVIYKSLINNQPVDGYKLVAGRSSRKWKDVKGLEEVLKDTPEAWTPPELKSVAQLEKVKSMKAIVNEWSFKQPGGMTLALESDKRPAANRAASDFDDVEID